MTKQERHLWYDFLRNYPVRILRQKVILNYIIDFYCSKAKLAIEIDGGQHYQNDKIEYDKLRTKSIGEFGIELIRFTNRDIDNNFENTCAVIDNKIKGRL